MKERDKRRIVFCILLTLTVCVLAGVRQTAGKADGGEGGGTQRIYFANASAQPGVPVEVLTFQYPIFRMRGGLTGS